MNADSNLFVSPPSPRISSGDVPAAESWLPQGSTDSAEVSVVRNQECGILCVKVSQAEIADVRSLKKNINDINDINDINHQCK